MPVRFTTPPAALYAATDQHQRQAADVARAQNLARSRGLARNLTPGTGPRTAR